MGTEQGVGKEIRMVSEYVSNLTHIPLTGIHCDEESMEEGFGNDHGKYSEESWLLHIGHENACHTAK